MTRLSESTLPLTQISLDSVHEKNVRHGHLSTLHIWPARRPLAASRAMIMATLLPDPGDMESRRRLGTRMAGRLVPKRRKDGGEHPKLKETSGGILHWGLQDGPELERLREEIRDAFGGRAPRAGPVRGRRGDSAGGDAAGLRDLRLGPEPGRVVHPPLRAPLPAPRGAGGAAVARFRPARPRLRDGSGQGTRGQDEGPDTERTGRPGSPRRRRHSAVVGAAGRRSANPGRLRVAPARVGTPGAGQRAPGAGGQVPDVGRFRARAPEGSSENDHFG